MSDARPWWKSALRWAEWVVWIAVAVFVIERLGPQLSAWTGIGPAEGSVPEWSVETFEGETLTHASLRGEVVVANFWATWCGPCRLEVPVLQSLQEEYGDRGVTVVGFSGDRGSIDPVREWLAERDVTYPVGFATGSVRSAFGGISAFPTTFVIDREGVVQHRVVGYFAGPAMRAAVERALGEGGEPETDARPADEG